MSEPITDEALAGLKANLQTIIDCDDFPVVPARLIPSLTARIEAAEAKCGVLEKERALLKATISVLRNTQEDIIAENDSLRASVATSITPAKFMQTNRFLSHHNDELRAENERLKETVKAHDMCSDYIKGDGEKTTQHIMNMQGTIRFITIKNEHLKARVKELEDESEKLKGVHGWLANKTSEWLDVKLELEQAKAELASRTAEVRSLTSVIRMLQANHLAAATVFEFIIRDKPQGDEAHD